MPREEGLITQMEREAAEVGLGGWFNGNPEDVPELEWAQLRHVGQSGSSGDNSPDHYWRLNLA